MKIVSFVPSLTETLIEAGLDVVGRTRFCIHPKAANPIPIVGGTKDGNWEKVRALAPDLVIFDREENTLEMATECALPYLSTHVTSLETLAAELQTLGRRLSNQQLIEFSQRAERLRTKRTNRKKGFQSVFEETLTTIPDHIEQVLYVIWKNPWMAVSRDTFVGDACRRVGFELPSFDELGKYPKIDLQDFDPRSTLLLFSSEPFPFRKHTDEISKLGFPAAIVDGECFSWFGIRSIRFLESLEAF